MTVLKIIFSVLICIPCFLLFVWFYRNLIKSAKESVENEKEDKRLKEEHKGDRYYDRYDRSHRRRRR